ncbi:WbqC family protein [Flavobacterium sp. WC2509]|uniref:WbqC family protein n=1 Tax=Flavobacterium sp. WC2509 TaxID=3461406 RepID=UPI004044D6F1
MKVAIMQPYLFPYLGYFQLINAVDKFIIYDDVNFIKQGWINRNTILVNNLPYLFTVPLNNQSSFDKINNIKIHEKIYYSWSSKFLKTIEQNYGKAPFYNDVILLLQNIFQINEEYISSIAVKSLKLVSEFIGINTVFEDSSVIYGNQYLSSQDRILDICMKEQANYYINLIGGIDLYSKEEFSEKGIVLNFIKSKKIEYKQFNDDFVPNLSIIDILMFNDVSSIKRILNNYELI